MSIQIRNGISPELARRAARVRDRRPILEAMGAQFVSISSRAFTDSSLRPSPWAPKKDGTPATLRKHGALWQSINAGNMKVTNDSVTVFTPTPYAAIHQFGGRTGRKLAATMPARPYFPILNGRLTPEAARRIEAIARAKINALLK